MAKSTKIGVISALRSESVFIAGAITTTLFLIYGDVWLSDLSNILRVGVLFIWIFAIMLWCAFGVVRHADCLADLLGEPYGTLILTLAVISIEVALISAIMLTGASNPALARDTMLAVIMIVLNGMVGVALLIGGIRHGEQAFNLQGARAFLAVIIPLATMSLILPRFTASTEEPTLTHMQAILFAVMTIALYATFLAIQTVRHRGFFVQPNPAGDGGASDDDGGHGHHQPKSVPYHAVFLILTMLPIVLLSKKLAVLVDHGIATLGAPVALGGCADRHSGTDTGRTGRFQRGARQQAAALGEHLSGLGAGDHRVDGAGGPGHRSAHRNGRGSRSGRNRHGVAGSDPGSQHAHLRRRSHQFASGCGALGGVSGLPGPYIQSMNPPVSDPVTLVIEPRRRNIGNLDVRRVLPSKQRQSVGPFVFLDHMGPATLTPGTGLDVPPHPHIGLATVTYLFEGALTHRDSLGFEQVIRPGDVNWMTAGQGIAHSERTPPEARARGGTIDGIQSWVALPRADEERAPSFHHHAAASLPEVHNGKTVMRLIAGEAFGTESPVKVLSRMFYGNADCQAGAILSLPPDLGERGVYVADGRISVAHRTYAKGRMLVFEDGLDVTIRAETQARLIVLGGAALDGPRHMWWNFVSSSKDRIERAKRDWSQGRFAAVPGETDFVPLPESGG